MCAARRGALAGIASVAGMRGIPGAGAYSASKAAAITYLEALRIELKPSGVKVVTVCPGYVATPMTAVNKYRMPFILPADVAARRIARVIDRVRGSRSARIHCHDRGCGTGSVPASVGRA
jgi:short-subunit dehydrogenase